MANNSGKGTLFEYSICQLFSEQNYFSRRSIPVVSPQRQDITDIDVLGIKFSYPFEKKIIICDCKNKVRSKPYERIFWTKGLGEYLGVDGEYIALPKVGADVIDIARQCNVRIITSSELYKMEDLQNGYADYNFYSEYMSKIVSGNNKNSYVMDSLNILKKEYLSDNPYKTLNLALFLIGKNNKENINDDEKRILFAESATLISFSLLDICRDVFGMNEGMREKYILKKLSYGDTDQEFIDMLMNDVIKYANEVLAEKIPKEYYSKDMIGKVEIPAPRYSYNCLAIVERAYNNPEWYIDILRNIDYILFEFMVKKQKFDFQKFSNYCKNYLVNEKLKACKNILFFICNASNMKLSDIWKEEIEFIPQNKIVEK